MDKKKVGRILWVIALFLAVGMIVLGVINGDAAAVFKKASTICMECIGLG